VIVATILTFVSGAVVTDTRYLAVSTEKYLANAVGMYASVPENEINVLNAQLTQKSAELDRREREIGARAKDTPFITDPLTIYALSLILLVQLALILTNYALDFRRARSAQVLQQVS
jgi:hypothetical protein